MLEEKCRETLLKKKKYYENCSGCQVDKLKKLKQGLTIREIISLWFVAVCNWKKLACSPGVQQRKLTEVPSVLSLFPFLYFMIRDFHIAKREEDIGYYAGFVVLVHNFYHYQAYATEVMRGEHQALGLSAVSTAWGIGLIMGLAVGGFLAQPAGKYPNIFSKESLFGKFPYFLPCFVISLIALGVTMASCWLPVHNLCYL
ncbi:hypothetical protein Pint_05501 [Pistacia integerrima]|uniref:Uncharacterized protein n=1 Tax=Pistacia integerrima TaxID=434235 RepID=A0ACC0Z491_9ROSI|nr:hypothetical protein Pint_05501 [Pistacia integerrima]